MKPFSIAAVQISLDNTDNFNLVERKTREVVARFPWVEMVVLSELAVGGANKSRQHSLDEYLPRLKEISKELDIWFIPGSFYDHNEGKITNSAPVLSPSGELVTTCVKTFPFLPYEVDVSAGDEACVFDVPGVGRFGIHICYDLWFPESSRELAMKGAEVILHPSLTDTCDRDVEKAMAIATAAQQQCYYIDINAAGKSGPFIDCMFCRRKHTQEKCPAYEKICKMCLRKGHFKGAKACKYKGCNYDCNGNDKKSETYRTTKYDKNKHGKQQ